MKNQERPSLSTSIGSNEANFYLFLVPNTTSLMVWQFVNFPFSWYVYYRQICLLPLKRIKMINLALPTAVNNHSVSIRCRNSPRISGKYFQQLCKNVQLINLRSKNERLHNRSISKYWLSACHKTPVYIKDHVIHINRIKQIGSSVNA